MATYWHDDLGEGPEHDQIEVLWTHPNNPSLGEMTAVSAEDVNDAIALHQIMEKPNSYFRTVFLLLMAGF